jgi:enoyl-CoA hydratase/carnithine racemase
MDLKNILIDKNEHTAILTINRPPANSWNAGAMEEFAKALDDVEKDRNIRVVIITGAGEKCFSAGFDVSSGSTAGKASDLGRILWRRVDRFPKPVIAVINGHALGGGLELAMSCHFRIMTDNPKAMIGLTELNLGIIPGWGGTQRLMNIVGKTKALDMILFSKRVSAAEAFAIGLVTRIAPAETLMEQSLEFAKKLSARPPIAVSAVLRSMTAGIYEDMDAGLDMETEMSQMVGQTKDAAEGFSAFIEKRNPVFIGE